MVCVAVSICIDQTIDDNTLCQTVAVRIDREGGYLPGRRHPDRRQYRESLRYPVNHRYHCPNPNDQQYRHCQRRFHLLRAYQSNCRYLNQHPDSPIFCRHRCHWCPRHYRGFHRRNCRDRLVAMARYALEVRGLKRRGSPRMNLIQSLPVILLHSGL